MVEPSWPSALARYHVPHRLTTRVRQANFDVASVPPALIVTPASGHPRRITEGEWERALPLLDRAGRRPLIEATFNSSYIAAIVDDLRRH